MKREEDPIADDEWLLRRVHRDKYRPDLVPTVRPSAFEPRGPKTRDPDHDGISFYRKSCLASPEEILRIVAADKRAGGSRRGLRMCSSNKQQHSGQGDGQQ